MRRVFPALIVTAQLACGAPPQEQSTPEAIQAEVIALERSALDRWITADPDGYLSLFASGVTYFDPTTEQRIDGKAAVEARVAPLRNAKLPFKEVRYEMLNPTVQRHGDVALLTYNVINYAKMSDQAERVISRWNSTEVYARVAGAWKIVHSHWSFVKPDIKQPAL
jgi:ketosteroid isomerase-like protein